MAVLCSMAAARCILCDRLLMGLAPPSVIGVRNPDALVLCTVCNALPAASRKRRRDQVMVRMLEDELSQRQRRQA